MERAAVAVLLVAALIGAVASWQGANRVAAVCWAVAGLALVARAALVWRTARSNGG